MKKTSIYMKRFFILTLGVMLSLGSMLAQTTTVMFDNFDPMKFQWDNGQGRNEVVSELVINPHLNGANTVASHVLRVYKPATEVNWAGIIAQTPLTDETKALPYVHVFMHHSIMSPTNYPTLKINDDHQEYVAEPLNKASLVANEWMDVVFDVSTGHAQGITTELVFIIMSLNQEDAEMYIEEIAFSDDPTPRPSVTGTQTNIPIRVVWNVDGVVRTEEHSQGDILTIPTDPTTDCPGYTFKCWTRDRLYNGGIPSSDYLLDTSSPYQLTRTEYFYAVFATGELDGTTYTKKNTLTSGKTYVFANTDNGAGYAVPFKLAITGSTPVAGVAATSDGSQLTGTLTNCEVVYDGNGLNDGTNYIIAQSNNKAETVNWAKNNSSTNAFIFADNKLSKTLTGNKGASITISVWLNSSNQYAPSGVSSTNLYAYEKYTGHTYINGTLHPDCSHTTWTVSFDCTGGTTLAPITDIPDGSTITPPTPPTKTGSDFVGWYKEYDRIHEWNFATDVVTENITLFAKWQAVTYDITYNPGTNGTGSQVVERKTRDFDITLKGAIFTRDGFTQTGWATADGGAKIYELGAAYSENAAITLYPFWTEDAIPTYTITYNPGINGTGSIPAGIKTQDITFTLSSSTFTRLGYTQTGWSRTDGGTKAFELGGAYITNEDITLYPVWEVSTYTVTYDPGANGTGSIPAGVKTHGSSFTLSSSTFTRAGFIQIGWATSEGGAKAYDLGGYYTRNENITLYPAWQATAATYTITYHAGANGTGTILSGVKAQDVNFTLSSETFSRDGYTQNGWATSDGGDKVYELGGTYTGNADLDLYPSWVENAPIVVVPSLITIVNGDELDPYLSLDLSATDVIISAGATLTLTQNITIRSLSMEGGYNLGQTQWKGIPELNANGYTITLTGSQTVNYDLNINQSNYYPLAVPCSVAVSAIDYKDAMLASASQYGRHYVIKRYDGASCAANGGGNTNWVTLTESDYLVPGVGYNITAVKVSGNAEIRIPLNLSARSSNIAVQQFPSSEPNNAGWNYIGLPYLSSELTFADASNLIVSIPNADYTAYNQDYTLNAALANGSLKPLQGFFVQVESAAPLAFSSTPAYAPARTAAAQESRSGVVLYSATEVSRTGIIVGENYTTDYEIGADTKKMFGDYGYVMETYTLSDGLALRYNALNETAAQNIPLGFRAPAAGRYSYTLDYKYDTEDFERIELVDLETASVINLMEAGYVFDVDSRQQNNERFILRIVKAADITTDITTTNDNANVIKILHKGQLIIIREGAAYNAMGVRIY